MRHITQTGLDLIKRWEGFEPEVYLDAAGLPTIGYGHLLRKGESWPNGISKTEAEKLLAKDVQIAERAVLRLIKVPLSDEQFDALVSFTFNLGSGALQRSTLRSKLNRGNYKAVPVELMRWVYAGGRKLKGLIRRRKAEGSLFASGDVLSEKPDPVDFLPVPTPKLTIEGETSWLKRIYLRIKTGMAIQAGTYQTENPS